MTACEKCWTEYISRRDTEPNLTYSDVLNTAIDRNGRDCTPSERCGTVHTPIFFKDGGVRCRCGKNVIKPAKYVTIKL